MPATPSPPATCGRAAAAAAPRPLPRLQRFLVAVRHGYRDNPYHNFFHAASVSHVVFMLLPLVQNIGREHHGAILQKAAQLAEAGKLRPHLHSEVFPFEKVGEAHVLLESGKTMGKIALSNS